MEQNDALSKFNNLYDQALKEDDKRAEQYVEERRDFYEYMSLDGISSVGMNLNDPYQIDSIEVYVHSASVAPENYLIGKDGILLCIIEEEDGAFNYILGPYKPECSDISRIAVISDIVKPEDHLPKDYYTERVFTTYENLNDLKVRLKDAQFYTASTPYEIWTDLTNRSTKPKYTMSSLGYDPRY
jgi:hypothetical protein